MELSSEVRAGDGDGVLGRMADRIKALDRRGASTGMGEMVKLEKPSAVAVKITVLSAISAKTSDTCIWGKRVGGMGLCKLCDVQTMEASLCSPQTSCVIFTF